MRIAIVEDDLSAAKMLEECLRRYEKENEVSFTITHYSNGFDFLEQWNQQAEIVFMDVDMPGITGIETARQMRTTNEKVVLIFVTNLAQYAIKGYEVDALDYVLKPVEYYAFKFKIKKAIRIVMASPEKVIPVVADGQVHYLKSSAIRYVEVEKHQLTYHTVDGDFVCEGSLKSVEELLTGLDFCRCNYCYLVNLRYVTALCSNEVQLGNTSLQISRNRKKAFVESLTKCYSRGGWSR